MIIDQLPDARTGSDFGRIFRRRMVARDIMGDFCQRWRTGFGGIVIHQLNHGRIQGLVEEHIRAFGMFHQ